MRILSLFAAGLLLSAASARAQVQEKKLVDRLLEPDMSLQNSAQNKRFNPGGSTKTKQASTKSFYVAERAPEKKFGNIRAFFAKAFGTKKAQIDHLQPDLKTRTEISTAQLSLPSSVYGAPRPARAIGEKKYEVSTFSGTRPFLVQGKSQKALNAPNRPMTIDEVRELLNKNK